MNSQIKGITIKNIRTLIKIAVWLFAFFSSFTILGCASTKKSWYKPNMDQDSWAIDSASCNSRANSLANKRMMKNLHETISGINIYRSYRTLMDNHGAKKNKEVFYRNCLETRGYQLITPNPSTPNKA